MILGDGVNILLELPSTVFVVETLPLAEIFHIAVRSLSMGHNAFNIAKSF